MGAAALETCLTCSTRSQKAVNRRRLVAKGRYYWRRGPMRSSKCVPAAASGPSPERDQRLQTGSATENTLLRRQTGQVSRRKRRSVIRYLAQAGVPFAGVEWCGRRCCLRRVALASRHPISHSFLGLAPLIPHLSWCSIAQHSRISPLRKLAHSHTS